MATTLVIFEAIDNC